MSIENLVSLPGTLAKTFSQLDPATIQHADEITTARRTKKELKNKFFWTADGAIYTVKDNQPVLYLARGKDNPIFKNIQEAVGQLATNHNYILKKEALETAINSEDTLKAKLSDLNLRSLDGEWSCFEINTEEYDQLNTTQRKVAERVYGQENDFTENMKMLKKAVINTTRVYVLTPSYVKKHAEKDGAITRTCRFNNFGNIFVFSAGGRCVSSPDIRLCGVPREIAEDTTQKSPTEKQEIDYAKAFDVIVNTLKESNKDKAKKLLNLVTNFYNKR